MTRLVSRVYDLAEGPPPTAREKQEATNAAKAEAWHGHGLLVVDPEDIHDDWLRQALINTANKLYGRRFKRGR